VGQSGSGKSTIIKLLTGEEKPTGGSVLVNGYKLESIRRSRVPHLRRTLGVIFQDFRLIENKTVYENVAFAMRVVGAKPSEIKTRVPYVLQLVGLENKHRRLPSELSGGEQQRVAIARALVNNPTMIIADEPTGNLDGKAGREVLTLLRTVSHELGITLVLVTHDMKVAEQADRIIRLADGKIQSDSGVSL
jgi:cell division transport system ATP-binding protein